MRIEMKLLPTEQQEAVVAAIAEFEASGRLVIRESCDCGDRVAHNNGGNYHQIITLDKDDDKIFVKYDDTCELTPAAEWEICKDWQAVIRDYADWL